MFDLIFVEYLTISKVTAKQVLTLFVPEFHLCARRISFCTVFFWLYMSDLCLHNNIHKHLMNRCFLLSLNFIPWEKGLT